MASERTAPAGTRNPTRGLRRVPPSNRNSVIEDEVTLSGNRKRRKKMRFKLFAIGAGMDMPLFILILILLATGLVMLFSASYAHCYFYYGDSFFFIRRQFVFALIGIAAMIAISFFDYHRFHKLAYLIFAITVLMLIMVLLLRGTTFAPIKGGANRWLRIGPVEFQPSEIAKFSLVVLYAHMISQRPNKMKSFREGFLPFVLVLGTFVILIVLEKHVSATIIISIIAVVMMFIGGTAFKWFAIIFASVVPIGFMVLTSSRFAYALDRIRGWIDPFNPPAGVDTWQTRQSLYAIGSGQLLGVGLGQSRQKYLYLPEPQNDFIFAIICEELGMIGALLVITLFALLIWRGIYVSLRARDKFGMMLGIGITFQFGLQAVLNICVVTNTIPNTGISLPFFSYGGTALMILLAEMGVLLQISRSSRVEVT